MEERQMEERQIAELWDDYSIDVPRNEVTFRAVSPANFKEFYTAKLDDEAAIRQAANDAREFSSGEWENNYIEEDL